MPIDVEAVAGQRPIVYLDVSKQQIVVPRNTATQVVDYTLEYEVVERVPRHVLSTVSFCAWGKTTYWKILADVNRPRLPFDWKVGEKLKIPLLQSGRMQELQPLDQNMV